MRRSALALTATLAGGLLLAGCGEEEGIPEGGTDRGQDEDSPLSPTRPPAIDAGDEEQPFDCFNVSPVAPGLYQVGDAGRVEIGLEDGELVVTSVEPAEGWEHDVDEERGLRIEVQFEPVADDGEDDPRDDDDFADASDAQEHLADSDDEEVLVLVVSQGPSADDVDPVAEVCTSLD